MQDTYQKCKQKINTRNNILRKLTSSKWGASSNVLRSSTLGLCYSTAKYAWFRSAHIHKLNAALKDSFCIITGCFKPTSTLYVYLLAGILREVACRTKRLKTIVNSNHFLNDAEATPAVKVSSKLPSPLDQPKEEKRIKLWKVRRKEQPHIRDIELKEILPRGIGYLENTGSA